jgi:hypothetical protein
MSILGVRLQVQRDSTLSLKKGQLDVVGQQKELIWVRHLECLRHLPDRSWRISPEDLYV